MRISLLSLLFCLVTSFVFAQKKFIDRNIAQKNYEGYLYMEEQKYDSALILFNEALEADPEAFFIYQNRALCHLKHNDTIRAIQDYKSNLRLEPHNAESAYALGNIYKYTKDSVNAKVFFTSSIENADSLFSQVKLLYMNNFVGNFYRLNAKYDSALIYYNQSKEFDPQNASVYINCAVCCFQLDSIALFCENLEQAYIHGGAVNCYLLKSYCRGCSDLVEQRGKYDTLSRALDVRLKGIIQDTLTAEYRPKKSFDFDDLPESMKKKRVYFNRLWQICRKENASFYREAAWFSSKNYFNLDFTDYYLDGKIYAKGKLNRCELTGEYACFYKSGTKKITGNFTHGVPTGTWTYYLENGTSDFQINFQLDAFTLEITNKDHPDFGINSGNGKFSLLLDKWEDLHFFLNGEYANGLKEGTWTYAQNNRKVVSETYKKGSFKRGYVLTDSGQTLKILNTTIDARVLIPPQLKQIRNLYFDDLATIKEYPFIRTSVF